MTRLFGCGVGALLLFMVMVLPGCGSSVKLSDVPVTDATSVAVSPGAASGVAQASGNGARGVQSVNVVPTAKDAMGPAGLARVILFDYDSFVIKPQYQNVIEAHARFLTANKGRKLMIAGHTDERGGREYNLALGQKRAEAVRRALALLGASDAQMEAVSFGKEKPLDVSGTEAGHEKNRRAELEYR